jgi:hypothetical protein
MSMRNMALPNSEKAQSQALQTLLDRAAITQVVQDWGLARDAGRWGTLRSFYTDDAIMHTTWFVGAASEFVARSEEGAKKGARAQHFIGAATIELQDERAIVETRMVLLVRGILDGMEVDVTCYGRFYDWFVKLDNRWLIKKRVPIYEKDRLDALNPDAKLKLDPELLGKHPDGYCHLAYLQAQGGAQITAGLPTPGSPALTVLYAGGASWLSEGAVQ